MYYLKDKKKIQSSYKAVLLERPYLIIGAILIKCDSCNKISAVKWSDSDV